MKILLTRIAPIFFGVAALASCGDSTDPPSPLVGSYTAVEFVTTGSSGQTNQILAGSTATITLAANHTTSGHLHVAASGSTPALDFDLTGSWTQIGNSVGFTQGADTFFNDLAFTAVAGGSGIFDLVGDGSFSGTAVHITLRQGVAID